MTFRGLTEFIRTHPIARRHPLRSACRILGWQVKARLRPGRHIHSWMNGVRFYVSKGESGLTGNIYGGLHEFADMAFVLHCVQADDLFVDVGSNVGSYTLLACGVRGARGVAFEPVPATHARLVANINLNSLQDRVTIVQKGVGEAAGELRFSTDVDCMNHVLSDSDADASAIVVPITTLDEALVDRHPAVMKIDVEGFEAMVLRGGRRVLEDQGLLAVIMEVNGNGGRYGIADEIPMTQLVAAGFQPFIYDPWKRTLSALAEPTRTSGNILFLRQVEEVRRRLAGAGTIKVCGESI